MKYIIAFLSALCALNCFSQDIVMEQDVGKDTIKPGFGPNMSHYVHTWFSYGFILGKPEGEGIEIQYGRSTLFSTGVRYKAKIFRHLAITADLYYNLLNFHIKQDTADILPGRIEHKREKLTFNNLGLQLACRVNYGKRGNYIGNYIDAGGYFEWPFTVKHYIRDNTDPAVTGAKHADIYYRNLTYISDTNYGLLLRLGFNKFAVTTTYRLSAMLRATALPVENRVSYSNTDLPQFTIGFEYGIFK